MGVSPMLYKTKNQVQPITSNSIETGVLPNSAPHKSEAHDSFRGRPEVHSITRKTNRREHFCLSYVGHMRANNGISRV